MKALYLSLLLLSSQLYAEVTKIPLTENVDFYQQQDKLRFYDSNQALIKSDSCLAIFDASGDFYQVERFAEQVKQQYTQPVCYLIASHPHDDHLLGMAVLQNIFPSAKLITHHNIANNFSQYQQALKDKLANFNKSIELSESRLPSLQIEQQKQWQKKITKAKLRLARWQKLTLQKPAMAIDKNTTLTLDKLAISIFPLEAHSEGDLVVHIEQDSVLLGGDVVDQLAYLGDANIEMLPTYLKQLQALQSSHVIPGHGKPFNHQHLAKSLHFVETLIRYANHAKASQLTLKQAQEQFDFSLLGEHENTKLVQRAQRMFVDSALSKLYQEIDK